MDGVMMRSETSGALAVRKKSGEIVIKKWAIKTRKNWFFRLFVIRGIVAFADMLKSGVTVLLDSAKLSEAGMEDMEPSRFEQFVAKKTGKKAEDVMMGFAVVISVILAVGLFILLPTFLTGLLKGLLKKSWLINLTDGLIRIVIFLVYMLLVSLMKEIRQVFMYHGAEHKTVSCYEHGEALTVENVRKYPTLHPRCGTSYLLIVMILTMAVFSLFGWSENLFLRLGLRLLMLPLIAGLSYEVLKLLARGENWLCRALRWPGMQLQRLTTKEPTDEMMEVAILAFEMALGEKSGEEIEAMRAAFSKNNAEPA